MKVDRHIPVPVNRYYHVECPYEVIKYIKKPYIVKVERKVPVEIVKKIPVPQPIISVDSILAEPEHIHADELDHSHHRHHHKHHHHHSQSFIEYESLQISQAEPIHIYGNQHSARTHHLHHYRRKRRKLRN